MQYSLAVPRVVRSFFIKAILVFVTWKLLYLLWLMPKGILDTPLTHLVGASTVATLNLFGDRRFAGVRGWETQQVDGGQVSGAVVDIYYAGTQTLRIANACNGLELMVLFGGFLFCYPGPPARRWRFLALGLGLIFIMNVARCALLVWIFLRYRRYLDFSHHFFFTFLVYACIFLLWWRYTLKPRSNATVVQSA
jgi:exosortase/archaeosortase family protein